jgi:hypothetical protein
MTLWRLPLRSCCRVQLVVSFCGPWIPSFLPHFAAVGIILSGRQLFGTPGRVKTTRSTAGTYVLLGRLDFAATMLLPAGSIPRGGDCPYNDTLHKHQTCGWDVLSSHVNCSAAFVNRYHSLRTATFCTLGLVKTARSTAGTSVLLGRCCTAWPGVHRPPTSA